MTLLAAGGALFGLFASSLWAGGLVSGNYHFQVPYSPVCLNGVYPLTVGDMTTGCTLSVNIDASGGLTGTLNLRSLTGPISGTFLLANNSASLQLETSGQDATGIPSQIDGQLIDGQFIGTATTSNGTVACTLDVSAAAQLIVTFDLTLTVDAQGQVSGTGTASNGGVVVLVNVTGTSGVDVCTLVATGVSPPDFVWVGTGKPNFTGFTAAYTAHGFGASRIGGGVVVAPKATAPALLGNISTRLSAQTGDNVLIGGFIVTGTQPKKVLIRAIGPSLPLTGSLADPKMELHDSSGMLLDTNDNWKDAANKQAIIDTTIPPQNDKESAILITLEPGAYTAIVSGVNNTTGIALVEVYDLDLTVDSKLANISTRGLVQTGDNVMIGGFIVLGTEAQKVMVRAIGPSLPVPDNLDDPTLELHDPNGTLLAANDDWVSDQGLDILATTIPPLNDKESAIVATLLPQAYTAIVRGVNGTSGVALVEAYALQP
jgi:hypothetical protein